MVRHRYKKDIKNLLTVGNLRVNYFSCILNAKTISPFIEIMKMLANPPQTFPWNYSKFKKNLKQPPEVFYKKRCS